MIWWKGGGDDGYGVVVVVVVVVVCGAGGGGAADRGLSSFSHPTGNTVVVTWCVWYVCAYQFRDRKKKNQFKANVCYETGRGEPLIPSPLLTQLSLTRGGFMNMVIWTFLLPVIKMLSDARRHSLPHPDVCPPAWQEESSLNLFPMAKSLLKPQKRHPSPRRSNTHGDRAT